MIATHESIESEIKQSYPSIHRLDGVPPPRSLPGAPKCPRASPSNKEKEECFPLSYDLALPSSPLASSQLPLRLRERSLEAHMVLIRAPAAAHLSYINPLNPRPGLIFSVSHT